MIDMYAEEKTPSPVDISGDKSVASEITFQSAKRDISNEWLLQKMNQSNADHVGGTTTRHTHPQTHHPSNDHISTIIELKLQVAQQKEMIDSLTLDLNHALSEKKAILSKAVSLTLDLNHEFAEKKAILSKAKQPAKTFTLASLVEEKAHSNNSRSLHEQYNELQEKLAAIEAENSSLRNERNMLQSRIARMSSKMDESNTSTACLTDFSESSGCEPMSPVDDLLHPNQPRRASVVGQSHHKLAQDSYLSWCEVKRRSSEPTVYSHKQQGKPKSSEWFIGDESGSSFLSKMVICWNKGTKSAEEQRKSYAKA